ncbi:hypothetical protein AB4P95_20255 [Pseudomonas sp. A1437]|uniref:hypothetical protein n=1 Tax=unclassified Pseudomonas TaxID=196821 RepID=UPI003783172D
MHVTTELTVVLKAREGEHIGDLVPFLKPGCTVQVGRSGAVVSGVSCGDKIAHSECLENQIVLAESAMRRGVVLHDQDHLPALTRVLSHIPKMYLEVADIIRQEAINDGSDPAEADEAAGQAIRVLVTFKQRLERMLGPDLLSTGTANYRDSGSLNTENPVVAETPYCEVRATNIDEWIRTVQNAKRYEFLRDRRRVQDMDTDLCAAREEKCFFGAELDTEIDNGIRLARLEEMHSCAD